MKKCESCKYFYRNNEKEPRCGIPLRMHKGKQQISTYIANTDGCDCHTEKSTRP